MKNVRVRVPATSANLGPGFDSFGLALRLYNEVRIIPAADAGPDVEVGGTEVGSLSAGRDNIAFVAAEQLLRHLGHGEAQFRLAMENNIPLARGLGSSAAARTGALVAANEWARRQGWGAASTAELVSLATQLEGHPDNAAAALLGGLTVSAVAEAGIRDPGDPARALALRMPVQGYPQFVVWSPSAELATKRARGVLPTTVPHGDAVFNVSRAGLLLAALASGDFRCLSEALGDRLHQTQRAALVPGWAAVSAAAVEAGAYGVTLSGAGSSMLLWLPPSDRRVLQAVSASTLSAAAAAGVTGVLRALEVDTEGATVVAD